MQCRRCGGNIYGKRLGSGQHNHCVCSKTPSKRILQEGEGRFGLISMRQPKPEPRAKKKSSLVRDLEALVELHRQGALTSEEFHAAKSRLLGN